MFLFTQSKLWSGSCWVYRTCSYAPDAIDYNPVVKKTIVKPSKKLKYRDVSRLIIEVAPYRVAIYKISGCAKSVLWHCTCA